MEQDLEKTDRSRLEAVPGATPGQRQTVDEVTVPGLGRGKVAWQNGPPIFFPEDGTEPLRLARVELGGFTVGSGSYLRVRLSADEPPISAKIHSSMSCSHRRMYSPTWGDVWLVALAGSKIRVEKDDGTVLVSFEWDRLAVGRPAYSRKSLNAITRSPKLDDTDELNWSTYESVAGEVFTFRRGGPPPEGFQFASDKIIAQLTPAAKKKYMADLQKHLAGAPVERASSADQMELGLDD
jgi:hypothetical protein